MSSELIFPELPHPYYWDLKGTSGATSIVVSTTGGEPEKIAEEVAWYWKPGNGFSDREGYECTSAPQGIGVSSGAEWFKQMAPTEQEAINLIVSFALLGIKKDG